MDVVTPPCSNTHRCTRTHIYLTHTLRPGCKFLMEYTLRSIHGLIHDVCPQLIFQQAVYQIRIEWLIFYQAAPLEWIIQGHRLWHLQHIPLHAFHHQVQFDFWKCYNKWSEINKNKARIRRKRILSLCTPNFLSYPCACLFVGLFVHTQASLRTLWGVWGLRARIYWWLSLLASCLWWEMGDGCVWGHTLITCLHMGSNDA